MVFLPHKTIGYAIVAHAHVPSYRAFKHQCALDDDYLADLKVELKVYLVMRQTSPRDRVGTLKRCSMSPCASLF